MDVHAPKYNDKKAVHIYVNVYAGTIKLQTTTQYHDKLLAERGLFT